MTARSGARRQPRLRRRYSPAEAVADRLRDRILSGDVPHGGLLPKLEDLTDEYGVSKASIREACRILETEGLLRVQRGNVGGAMVHAPEPELAAYTVGLVLQARDVSVPDVATAVERFEPICAELCAERADRATTVLPELREAQAELAECIERSDGEGAAGAARRWHEGLVTRCGNETTAVLIGTLAGLWTAHARNAAAESAARGVPMSDELSRRVYAEHEHIQALIEAGDAVGAAAAARAHVRTARIHPPSEDDPVTVVRATTVRDRLFG
ncbi:MAG TPA: GntR family transcriptional regulator [Acidimicrobiales bacterium]|jgi:DNA-binding FadR family transcriptional regulator|nr:GntR family transcriptional regulator [Acidimicrobiales bacterium]